MRLPSPFGSRMPNSPAYAAFKNPTLTVDPGPLESLTLEAAAASVYVGGWRPLHNPSQGRLRKPLDWDCLREQQQPGGPLGASLGKREEGIGKVPRNRGSDGQHPGPSERGGHPLQGL